jgi:serine/threonine protein kinase/Tfp pilus assembly protein PilF
MQLPIPPLNEEPLTLRVAGRPPLASAEETLVQELAERMRQRWEAGERPLAEEFLQAHPELMEKPDLALDLVYEEISLRQKFGLEHSQAGIERRFPQWREPIAILFECHQLLEPVSGPAFPKAGDHFGDFHLVSELGRGVAGRVFLATQTSLAHRVVVLKLTPGDDREHLTLARLQHTWIVPLYDANLDVERRLRWLCLPYFGGMSLAALLQRLAGIPVAERTGRDALAVLDEAQRSSGAEAPKDGPMRELIERFDLVQTVCTWGVCLAEALQYAHDRGLLHLDVKPSNILIAADGQPMLLDFHLAHAPLRRGSRHAGPLGGTPATMPDEQRQAMLAVQKGEPIPRDVDQRADVHGLAASLYEALGGRLPYRQGESPDLRRVNGRVSQGLSDLVAKALESDPQRRLRSAGEFAADLRRHLQDEPLHSVPNRSWRERWGKWRRRRPTALRSVALVVGVLGVSVALAASSWLLFDQRREEAESALVEGRELWQARGQHEQAIKLLQRGRDRVQPLPFTGELAAQLDMEMDKAQESLKRQKRLQLRQHLHEITDQMRGLFGVHLPPAQRRRQDEACRQMWDRRKALAEELDLAGDSHMREDFLDLFLLWLDGPAASLDNTARLAMLDEVEALTGSNSVLQDLHRQFDPAAAGDPQTPRTPWEHFALGRQRLLENRLDEADALLREARKLQPADRWINASFGLLSYRLKRYDDALLAFAFCVGSDPNHAVNHYNLGLAQVALGQTERALDSFDRAIVLDASFADAWRQRGVLHLNAKRLGLASRDLEQALKLGSSASDVRFSLSRIALARGQNDTCIDLLRQVLDQQPDHAEALALRAKLQPSPR